MRIWQPYRFKQRVVLYCVPIYVSWYLLVRYIKDLRTKRQSMRFWQPYRFKQRVMVYCVPIYISGYLLIRYINDLRTKRQTKYMHLAALSLYAKGCVILCTYLCKWYLLVRYINDLGTRPSNCFIQGYRVRFGKQFFLSYVRKVQLIK